jgi:hypothetical protein
MGYQKFGFGYQTTVNDLYSDWILRKFETLINTFDGLLIAFEYYEFATSLRTSI